MALKLNEIKKIMQKFLKMHGLGNDFVFINKQDLTQKLSQEFIQQICNRRLGVGCDQLIIYNYDSNISECEMEIFNNDGTSAEACGNATRCLGLLMKQKHNLSDLRIKVAGRLLTSEVLQDSQIKVNMGKVSFQESWMLDEEQLWQLAALYKIDPKKMICVDVGNPHLVIFNDQITKEDQEVLGIKFEKKFTNGANISFAKIKNNEIYADIWERGAGFTLACGSGACAIYAAAQKTGLLSGPININFKLGTLSMDANPQGDLLMTGPAEIIFEGEYCNE